MPLFHAKGWSLSSSLNIQEGKHFLELARIACFWKRLGQRRLYTEELKGSLSDIQASRVQVNSATGSEGEMILDNQLPRPEYLGGWGGLWASDEASSDPCHSSTCAWSLRLPGEAVSGKGKEWRLWGQPNLVVSSNAVSSSRATVDRLQSLNPHFHRTETIPALNCQSCDASLR